jgi:hypothetical protein
MLPAHARPIVIGDDVKLAEESRKIEVVLVDVPVEISIHVFGQPPDILSFLTMSVAFTVISFEFIKVTHGIIQGIAYAGKDEVLFLGRRGHFVEFAVGTVFPQDPLPSVELAEFPADGGRPGSWKFNEYVLVFVADDHLDCTLSGKSLWLALPSTAQ